MFTDKAKEKFEEWLISTKQYKDKETVKSFFVLPLSYQWGVIQDFADSLGYSIHTELTHLREEHFFLIEKINSEIAEWVSDIIGTRQQARTEAIKKLNELINK